jgi:hypothetical protein
MRFAFNQSTGSIIALCLALPGLALPALTRPAIAQNARPLDRPTPNSIVQQGTLTGKERLGRKWMDEQRIDNCNVPMDKRGTKPRPASCSRVPTG